MFAAKLIVLIAVLSAAIFSQACPISMGGYNGGYGSSYACGNYPSSYYGSGYPGYGSDYSYYGAGGYECGASSYLSSCGSAYWPGCY